MRSPPFSTPPPSNTTYVPAVRRAEARQGPGGEGPQQVERLTPRALPGGQEEVEEAVHRGGRCEQRGERAAVAGASEGLRVRGGAAGEEEREELEGGGVARDVGARVQALGGCLDVWVYMMKEIQERAAVHTHIPTYLAKDPRHGGDGLLRRLQLPTGTIGRPPLHP